ncbi:MAG: hypothetical protein ACRDOI_14010 [Trebonia sp.]
MVFVTHDVDEAIALADRVLVLKDGMFSTDLDELREPRPRDKTADAFVQARGRLLAELGVRDNAVASSLTTQENDQ